MTFEREILGKNSYGREMTFWKGLQCGQFFSRVLAKISQRLSRRGRRKGRRHPQSDSPWPCPLLVHLARTMSVSWLGRVQLRITTALLASPPY